MNSSSCELFLRQYVCLIPSTTEQIKYGNYIIGVMQFSDIKRPTLLVII